MHVMQVLLDLTYAISPAAYDASRTTIWLRRANDTSTVVLLQPAGCKMIPACDRKAAYAICPNVYR